MAGARASVVDLKSDGIAFVDFSGLPALAPGKVYELWLIGGANRVDAAGVFVPDSNGSKVVVVTRPLAGYTTMAVTTEQGPDGVSAPTQQPQLAEASPDPFVSSGCSQALRESVNHYPLDTLADASYLRNRGKRHRCSLGFNQSS